MKRLIVLLAVACAVPLPAPAATGPTFYAHRGGAAVAPENTLGAFRATSAFFSAEQIQGWLELDAQLTSDGVMVVIHDDSLDRTTNCTGDVIATTYAELAGCDAAEVFAGWPNPEPIPRLVDVLAEGRDEGWRLMIELKNIPTEANFEPTGLDAASVFVDLIHSSGFPLDRLIVQSFYPPALDAVQVLDPAIALQLLTTSQLPGAPAGVGFTLSENAAVSTARAYAISSPDDDTLDLDATGVAAAHALGREVIVWTVDSAARVAELAALGVDGVITNDPRLALR